MATRGVCRSGGRLGLAVCLFLLGCNGSAVTAVSVTASPMSASPGMPITLTASVLGTGNFSTAVTWSVDGGGTGLVPQGLSATYTVPSSAPAAVVIRATSVEDSTKSGTVMLTISTSPVTLNLIPDATRLYAGQTINIDASVTGPPGVDTDVTWSLVSGGGTLSATTGSVITYTAPAVSTETAVVVRAVPAAAIGQPAEVTLTVDHGWPQVLESTADAPNNAPQDNAVGVAVDYTNFSVSVAGETNSGHFDIPASLGMQDGFVAAFDRYGNLSWVHQFGTESTDLVTGVVADAAGNVYVGGYTLGRTWTPGPAGPSAIGYAGFLLAYDAAGTFLWREDIGPLDGTEGSSQCAIFGLAVDQNNNVYAAGSCATPPMGLVQRCTATGCDGPSGGMLTLVAATMQLPFPFFSAIAVDVHGAYDLVGSPSGGAQGSFVTQVQANTSSTPVWVQTLAPLSSSDSLVLTSVAVDQANDVYVGGSTSGTLSGQTSNGGQDAVLALYDASGNPQWALQFGTANDDAISGLVFDPFTAPDQEVIATGSTSTQTNPATTQAFVSFYNFQGQLASPQVLFDPGANATGGGVTVGDGSGNLFIGYTTGAQLSGPPPAGLHVGVQKLDTTGNPLPL